MFVARKVDSSHHNSFVATGGDTVSVRRNRRRGSRASELLDEAAAAMLQETYRMVNTIP